MAIHNGRLGIYLKTSTSPKSPTAPAEEINESIRVTSEHKEMAHGCAEDILVLHGQWFFNRGLFVQLPFSRSRNFKRALDQVRKIEANKCHLMVSYHNPMIQ